MSIDMIRRTLDVLVPPGDVVELRVLGSAAGGSYPARFHGYFDDMDELAKFAHLYDSAGAQGVYITLNPVDRRLLARSANAVVRAGTGNATSDGDVIRRRLLFIDLDAGRPSGISSTEDEHRQTLARARDVVTYLRDTLGFANDAMVLGDSGNGAHVLVRIDLPNDQPAKDLLERCLAALALLFDDAAVQVDTGVVNAARLVRLYGTHARKGSHTTERPHRPSRLLQGATAGVTVSMAQLTLLADQAPVSLRRSQTTSGAPLDVSAWLSGHGIGVKYTGPWQGGTKWVLDVCPWNPAHVNRSAYVVQFSNGAIAAGCHHNSCSGKTWQDLRDLKEPGWRNAPGRPRANGHLVSPVCLADVTQTPIEWLWPGYIPIGKVTLLFGDPGVGKGLFLASLASAVSLGAAIGSKPVRQGTVLWIAGEDDAGDTIKPRVLRCGGDCSRINVVQSTLDLSSSMSNLDDEVARLRPTVVFLDPLVAFLGGRVDPNRSTHMRPIFDGLGSIARRHSAAVLVVHHPNKGDGYALHRASGSYDVIAAVRSVLVMGAHRHRREDRALFCLEKNLAPAEPQGYRVHQNSIVWTGATALTLHDVFGDSRETPTLNEAIKHLDELLQTGPMPAAHCFQRLRAIGISESTVRRAGRLLGVKSRTVFKANGTIDYWIWEL